ncbi:MAG: O-antigen ligase family protein [Bacteroidota bacterium]
MEKIKALIIFVCLFILFYFEPEEVGPITFSQLWKIPLFFYLFWHVIVLGLGPKPAFVKWAYVRAVKTLFNKGFFIDFMAEVTDFMRYMMFPLMYGFAARKIKNIVVLDKILLGFAQFVILSGIPFLLGLLESKGKVLFEMERDLFQSYTGIFQNPHSASITTATAVIIILAMVKSKSAQIKFPKLNLLLACFGIYIIYLTYVRTGYLMFAVGLFIVFKPQKFTLQQIVLSVIVSLVLIFGFVYLLETNEFFYNRIFDIRNGRQTAVGSGRLDIWEAAIDLWMNGNFLELLLGHGFEELTKGVQRGTGMKVYAHNEFFTQLGQNGLLGFVFTGVYLYALFKHIWKRRENSSYKLALGIYCLYFSLMLTQGGVWFPLDIFMVLVFLRLDRQPSVAKISPNEIGTGVM